MQMKLIATACMLAALSACSDKAAPVVPQANAASDPVTTASAATEYPSKANDDELGGWTGKWTGVEGTYLSVERAADGSFPIKLADLDGEKTYTGTGKDDSRIEFTRNGKTETIRRTDGIGTGMKWLADRNDCLVVTKGSEGFCRN